jgi:hypothetical protein
MRILILLCSLFIAIKVTGQVNPLQQYIKNLDSFYRYTPLEKAFLHTDKDWYFPAETIWFKAYVTVDDERNELSRIIYAELTDSKGKVIEKTRWKLQQMQAKGDIYLSKELKPGFYILRAYTLYMLNYKEVIDEKIITILSDSTAQTKSDGSTSAPVAYIMPEGGKIVTNLASKVAYKLTLPNQLPLQQTTVKVTDDDNNIIYEGTPIHDGMGFFDITPLPSKKYKLSFDLNGIIYTKDLPSIDSSGVVLTADNRNANKIFLSIATNNTSVYSKAVVTAQMNGVTVYAQNYDLSEGFAAGAIDKKNLPNGVLTITCFTSTMVPLCERLIYIHKYKSPDLQFKMDALHVGAKVKNQFFISGFTDSTLVSIAVTDADEPLTPFTNHNIISYFLLGSEVKGYVHNPFYYFRKQDSSTFAHLDLVMLTNGWRRFKTTDIVRGKMPLIQFYPETGIAITGTVKDQFRKKLNTGGIVNAIIKTDDSVTIYTDAVFSENGKFIISGLDFKKRAKLYVKEIPEHKGLTTALDIDAASIDTLNNIAHFKHELYKTQIDTTGKISNPIAAKFKFKKTNPNELAEIIVTGKSKTREEKLTDEYASEQFKQSEYSYTVDSNIAYFSIWQFLQANVPGLNVGSGHDPNVNFNRYAGLREASTGADQTFVEDINGGKSSIAFYLNEVLVPIESVTDLNPKDVALIKVNRNPNIGLNNPNGSIFIYTRKGALYGRGIFNQKMITGYNSAKEFFHPVYEQPESISVSDLRTTLYWNPDLKINNNSSLIQFYNNDVTKRFRVIVCGLSKDGYPFYMERVIE